jgi:hypothetical protein
MRTRLTQRDIDAGERGDCLLCAMTLAANRATHRRCRVDFTGWACRRLVLIIDGVGVVATLPPEARRWVKDYDAGRRVKPLAFAVKLMQKGCSR